MCLAGQGRTHSQPRGGSRELPARVAVWSACSAVGVPHGWVRGCLLTPSAQVPVLPAGGAKPVMPSPKSPATLIHRGVPAPLETPCHRTQPHTGSPLPLVPCAQGGCRWMHTPAPWPPPFPLPPPSGPPPLTCCSCCRKDMTERASLRKRSRPTAMPTREMHSSALARSVRWDRSVALIRMCVRRGITPS